MQRHRCRHADAGAKSLITSTWWAVTADSGCSSRLQALDHIEAGSSYCTWPSSLLWSHVLRSTFYAVELRPFNSASALYRTQSTARKVLFLALSVTFLCVWNVSGTAQRICAKFTGKTCLVPRSEGFEGQCQRSRSPGTKTAFSALSAACVRFVFGITSLTCSSYLLH